MTSRHAAKNGEIDSFEVDGVWCPMGHCNRSDTSAHDLPPLRYPTILQEITDPRVPRRTLGNHGAFTGEQMAVCTYALPSHPALVAYDYQDGSVRWTSPVEDLQPGLTKYGQRTNTRAVSALLLAKLRVDGGPVRRCVFAANPREFVAYTDDGDLIWRRVAAEITPAAPEGIGSPTSLSYSDAHELVAATRSGWVIKLNPLDGRTIDAYRMETTAVIGDRVYRGTLLCYKNIVVIGNVLYAAAYFEADTSTPLPPALSPVYVVRIELSPSGETQIKPLSTPTRQGELTPDRIFIGLNRAGRPMPWKSSTGSPSAWVTPQGKVLIFANARALVNRRLTPVIVAVEDDDGVLSERWRSVLRTMPGDAILSAPAFHADSRTLVVGTMSNLFVFQNVDTLAGNIPSPLPFWGAELLAGGPQGAAVSVGSPFALAFDPDASEIVAYTNFRIDSALEGRPYGLVGAFALPVDRPTIPRPLWARPLGLTSGGTPVPGPGTFGHPALFRYTTEAGQGTGLIMNTHTRLSGTYIIK
jgi:outer membrane protein assembly factor BamB